MRWRENVRYLLLRIVRKRTTKSWNQSDLDKSLKDKRQPQTLHVSDAWSCLLHIYGVNVPFSPRSILLMAWFQINQVIDVFDQLLFRGSLEWWDTPIDLSIGDIFKKWFRHFGRILRVGGSTENIIGADLVIIRQFYQMPKRQIRPVCFIAGIDLLSCTQQTGNFRLRFSFVLP